MKKLFTFFAAVVIIGCGSTPSVHEGEPQMSDNITVTLTESLVDKSVSASVELTAGPEGYTRAELAIDGDTVGEFGSDNKIVFFPSAFGDIDCSIVYYDAAGAVIETREDTLKIRIETWFMSVQNDLGYTITVLENTDAKLMYTQPRAIGSHDRCWMYEIRVPYNKTMRLTASVTEGDLAVHFRGADYADRNDLYTPPDEALYHIDTETDKWIASPYEIGQGLWRIYVAPSAECSLSFLRVVHASEGISGEVTGWVKTLVF
jgi:hypothetical protein